MHTNYLQLLMVNSETDNDVVIIIINGSQLIVLYIHLVGIEEREIAFSLDWRCCGGWK